MDFSIYDLDVSFVQTSMIEGPSPHGRIEGNYTSKEEMDNITKDFLNEAINPNSPLIVHYKKWKLYNGNIKREIVILEDESQEPMTRNAKGDSCCHGTTVCINVYTHGGIENNFAQLPLGRYRYSGYLYYEGKLSASFTINEYDDSFDIKEPSVE